MLFNKQSMTRILHFILFFSLSVTTLAGQNNAQDSILAYQYLDKTVGFYNTNKDSFRICIENALPLLQKIGHWEPYIDCLNALSNIHYQEEDYEKFERYVIKAFEVSTIRLPEYHQTRSVTLNNLSFLYKEKGKFDKAISSYKKALDIQKKVNPSAKPLIRLYQNISAAYRKKGDFDEAISYLDQALQIQKDSLSQNDTYVGKTYLDLAHVYRDKGMFEKAKKYSYQCITALSPLDLTQKKAARDYLIYCHQNLAKLFYNQELLDSSIFHIELALALQDEEYQSRRIASYEILGEIYQKQGNFKSSLKAFENADGVAQDTYKSLEKKDTKAKTKSNIAKAYFLNGDFERSFFYYQSALIALSLGFEEKSIDKNPPIDQMVSKLQGLKIIEGKAQAFLKRYDLENNSGDLELAFENYKFATEIIQSLRQSFLTAGSKNELAEQSLNIYEGAIKTAFLLFKITSDPNYKESAYLFAEQNKARLLEESLQEDFAKLAGGLPVEELEKEQELSTEINFYESKINREKSKSSNIDQEKIKMWSAALFEINNKYHELIDRFEKEYPGYYSLKYAIKNTSIEDIRAKVLTDDTALLEYFVGAENIYLFSITKNDFRVFEMPKFQSFENDLASFRTIISQSPHDSKNNFDDDRDLFLNLSHQLYQKYLGPAINTLSESIKNLIIIPDDILAYLPFELLLTQKAREGRTDYSLSSCPYLLKEYAISYNYSIGLLANHSEWKNQPELEPFIGYAPTFGETVEGSSRSCSDDDVYTLQCNEKEVASIQNLFGGSRISGEKAHVRSFEEKAQQCRILHLATHACINEENPNLNKIYFSDNYVTGTELNNLTLNAELAVLSACNTGSGKLIKGEGVMSLSRGFILSGCPSTLTSLWSVDDCTTSEIMLGYYKNLKEGLSKDQALRKAKLDYLSSTDKANSHPYYWAAFVQSGNIMPMDLSKGISKNWWFLLLLLILVSILFYRKK